MDEPDTIGPTICRAVTLTFSSPVRRNFNKFLNAPAATIRYMPIWSWDEIDECRRLLFGNDASRSAAKVQEAYTRWGGIPRHVLEKVGDTAWQKQLDNTISEAQNIEGLVKLNSADSAERAASHQLVHMIVQAPYDDYAVILGSPYIINALLSRFVGKQRSSIESFLDATSEQSALASMRGQVFEAYAHRILAAGGDFKVRNLSDGLESVLHLEKSTVQYFWGMDDLPATLDKFQAEYLIPRQGTFPAVDALSQQPLMLLQMTVSPSHDVSINGLDKLVSCLDARMAAVPRVNVYDLVFVVPAELYDGFSLQEFKFPKDKTATDFAPLPARVSQKVLKLKGLGGSGRGTKRVAAPRGKKKSGASAPRSRVSWAKLVRGPFSVSRSSYAVL